MCIRDRYTKGVRIRVNESTHGDSGLEQLQQVVKNFPGSRDLELHLQLTDGRRVVFDTSRIRVDVSPEFRQRVDEVLSPGNVRLITERPQSKPGSKKPWQRG